MTEWVNKNLEDVAEYFRRHSHLFKGEYRALNKDALVGIAKIYAILEEMQDREEYAFIDNEYIEGIKTRISWAYHQMLIDYRINYKEYLKFKDDNKRFFEITPTGNVVVDQRIYNIPKHYTDKGMYPDLSSGSWIKEYENKEV